MVSTLPTLNGVIENELDKFAPVAAQAIRAVKEMLERLLKVDGHTGLAFSTVRLAELAMEYGPDARQAARHVEQCRQRDFPEAFREGRAQPERREVESLAKEIVEKIAQFDQQMKEAKGHERAHDALLHARSYLRLDLLPDFWLELKKRIGDARYEHFKSQVDKLPIGAVWSFADSEEEESLTKASIGAREGGYRRARIYGM